MIEADRINKLINYGMSAVCSWCEHLYNNLDLSDGKTFRCGKEGCNGPAGNPPGTFVKYKGPLEGNLTSICFVCGKKPDAMVDIQGGGLGVCKEHIELFRRMLNRPGQRINVKEGRVYKLNELFESI